MKQEITTVGEMIEELKKYPSSLPLTLSVNGICDDKKVKIYSKYRNGVPLTIRQTGCVYDGLALVEISNANVYDVYCDIDF